MMGSSSSVVSTVSLLPSVKMVERFLKVVRVEKKPRLGVSSAPIRSSFSATSSNCGPTQKTENITMIFNPLFPFTPSLPHSPSPCLPCLSYIPHTLPASCLPPTTLPALLIPSSLPPLSPTSTHSLLLPSPPSPLLSSLSEQEYTYINHAVCQTNDSRNH